MRFLPAFRTRIVRQLLSPSNDQTSGDGSQIIGSKSQYNQQKPGFLLHTQSNVTTELQNAGKNADGVEGSCCGKDGRLVLKALSTPTDNGWRKTVIMRKELLYSRF